MEPGSLQPLSKHHSWYLYFHEREVLKHPGKNSARCYTITDIAVRSERGVGRRFTCSSNFDLLPKTGCCNLNRTRHWVKRLCGSQTKYKPRLIQVKWGSRTDILPRSIRSSLLSRCHVSFNPSFLLFLLMDVTCKVPSSCNSYTLIPVCFLCLCV